MLQTAYASASSNLCSRYPQNVHTGDSLSADTLASSVACRVGDEVYLRPDGAMLTQQVPCVGGGGGGGADETGTDLESTLDGIAASAALFESLAGSSVMLDLYDVFANPSAFPFPPEVGDHVATTLASSATPMDMDVAPATEYGFMPPSTCQPEVFTSSAGTCAAVSEHQLMMTCTSGQSLEQFEMKVDNKSPPNQPLSQCQSHGTQQNMDVTEFRTSTCLGNDQLISAGFRYVFSVGLPGYRFTPILRLALYAPHVDVMGNFEKFAFCTYWYLLNLSENAFVYDALGRKQEDSVYTT